MSDVKRLSKEEVERMLEASRHEDVRPWTEEIAALSASWLSQRQILEEVAKEECRETCTPGFDSPEKWCLTCRARRMVAGE